MRLENKTALITGANSGIGQAVAIDFAKEGADVAVIDLEDGRETVDAVDKHGRRAVLIHGDVGMEQEARRIVAETINEFGRIDILVNNAGVEHLAPLEEVSRPRKPLIIAAKY